MPGSPESRSPPADEVRSPVVWKRRLNTTVRRLDPVAGRFGMDTRAFAVVLAAGLVGLLARLAGLGHRVFHWDEARVGYWILEATRTGEWHYRFIIHGPFVQHADRYLFPLLGPTDFAARLPVALVGGLLPLSALLFRDRLRDWEVAALALFLAANPLLLYYSRFMRSDLLVGGFMLVALGMLVRLYETRQPRYLYLASVFLAFGFASKENSIVYVACWAGALGLVAGLEVLYPRRFASRTTLWRTVRDRASATGRDCREALRDRRDDLGRLVARYGGHLGAAVALFGLLTLFFFAPRAGSTGGTGLWSSPLPAVVEATVADMQQGFEYWLGGSEGPPGCGQYREEGHFVEKYVCNLGRELAIVGKSAGAVGALAVVGVAVEWTREEGPRVLVPAAFYWGVASLLGYPLASDISFPAWLAVHAVIPLSITAAVGLVALAGWLRDARADEDWATVSLSAILLAVVLVGTVGIGVNVAYVSPQSGQAGQPNVAQYAQPAGEMKGTLRAVERISHENEGVDVLVYGSDFVDMASDRPRRPSCVRWFQALPLPWYLERANANVTCAEDPQGLDRALDGDPPVVIARKTDADDVDRRLGDGYARRTYRLRLWGFETVFFVEKSRLDGA